MPGPVPNRTDDLARPRERGQGAAAVPVTKGVMRPVRWPAPDPAWHKIAKDLYKGCKASGQADFYQQSDIAMLWSLCEDLSVYKKPNVDRQGVEYTKRSGQMLQAIYSSFERLLVTEGDRRRVRIELDAPEPDKPLASVTAIADYEKDLGLA